VKPVVILHMLGRLGIAVKKKRYAMWRSEYLIDFVFIIIIVKSMHNNEEPNSAPEESTPEEQESQQVEGAEEPEAQESQEGEDEVLEPPFGVDANQQVLEQAAKMFVMAMQQLLNRRSSAQSPRIQMPQPPPADLRMPRDLAHDLLLELYKEKEEPKQDNRQYRIGMGLGAAINMMGVQVLSEDLLHMLTNFFSRGNGRSRPSRDPLDLIRIGGIAQPARPIRHGVAIPPEDPFENSPGYDSGFGVDAHHAMDPDQFARWAEEQRPEPMRASGEDIGFSGIPPMPDIGPQMREEAERRWERMQQYAPEKAEEMKAQGFTNVEDLFIHFEKLFGDFFPLMKQATEPPADDDSDSPQEKDPRGGSGL